MIVKLKEIREKKKLLVREMAEKVGITSAYGDYNRIEAGKVIPRVDKAIRIARSLGKKVEDIWIIK